MNLNAGRDTAPSLWVGIGVRRHDTVEHGVALLEAPVLIDLARAVGLRDCVFSTLPPPFTGFVFKNVALQSLQNRCRL
jgi:hypothetical protein